MRHVVGEWRCGWQTRILLPHNLLECAVKTSALRLFGILVAGVVTANGLHPAGSALARSIDYFSEVRANYPVVLLVTIRDGETIQRSEDVEPCYYSYHSTITEIIRGKVVRKDFDFFSQASLAVGAEYLVFYSEVDARKYRIYDQFGGQQDAFCRQRLDRALLLNDEVHPVKEKWNGTKFAKFVRFSDPQSELANAPVSKETEQVIPFDYVRELLAKP